MNECAKSDECGTKLCTREKLCWVEPRYSSSPRPRCSVPPRMDSETAMAGERAAALLASALRLCGATEHVEAMDYLADDMRRRSIDASRHEESDAHNKQLSTKATP